MTEACAVAASGVPEPDWVFAPGVPDGDIAAAPVPVSMTRTGSLDTRGGAAEGIGAGGTGCGT